MRDLPAPDSIGTPATRQSPRKRHIPFSLPFPLMRRNLPFWRGFLVGGLLLLPLVALAVWQACQVLVFDPAIPVEGRVADFAGASLVACLRSTYVFGGFAAVITAGGMGRAVWFRSMRRHPAVTFALTVAGAALVGVAVGTVAFTALGLPLDGATYGDMFRQSIPLVWRCAAAGALFGVALTWICRAPRPAALRAPKPRTAAGPAKRLGTAKRRKKAPARRSRK